MRTCVRIVVLATIGMAAAAHSEAAPIVYLGSLPNGSPVAGVNTQAPGNDDNPIGADYWLFEATAGANVDIFADRQAGHFDPSFWIFSGMFADTNQFGASFDSGDAGFIDFGDDEDAPNIAGPFGDPHVFFVAPSTGLYTIAVTNFLSNSGPPNPYTLQGNNINPSAIPEPASMLLLGSGITGLVAARRRARARRAR